MERDEALKRTDHYRCRLCRQISPITETLCTRPGCRAQLGIYGEIVAGEENANTSPSQGSEVRNPEEKEKKKYTIQKEKPAKEKKQPREKRHKENPAAYTHIQTGKPFLQKKTLLIWLNMIFLLVYGLMAFCAEQVVRWSSTAELLLCIGIMLAITILAITLARIEKHIFHGIVCILGGAVSFVAAGAVLSPPGDTVHMFLAMVAAYWWLGIFSFLGTSRKRRALAAEGRAPLFLKKKTILILLDIVVLLVICGALICFRAGLYRFLINGKYRLYFDDCIIPCAFQLVITLPGMVLACKEKHVLRGILLCVIGAVGAISVLAYSNHMLYVLIGATVGALHVWLGIISFLKEE